VCDKTLCVYITKVTYALTHGRLQAQEGQGQEEGDFQEVWKEHPAWPSPQARAADQERPASE